MKELDLRVSDAEVISIDIIYNQESVLVSGSSDILWKIQPSLFSSSVKKEYTKLGKELWR